MADVDITSRIKLIESLKCALLSDISLLYENMRIPGKQDERDESLAALLTHTYLLAGQLGFTADALDEHARQGLKRELLKQENHDISALLKHLSRGGKTSCN